MHDFVTIDFEGYGINIRCINFTACLPHHVNALTPQVISFICRQLPAASTWRSLCVDRNEIIVKGQTNLK